MKDAQGNWDGDDGYEETIELDNDTVTYALVEILIDESSPHKVSLLENIRMKEVIVSFIDKNDLLDTLYENYKQELEEWVQEEYGE